MSLPQDLAIIANELRIEVLKMVHNAGAGHVAGPLSSADIIATLYFSGLVNLETDKIVLSCGHYVPIQYAALARLNYFPQEELSTFMKTGSRLPGHPERGMTPGIEVSAGPLGQGVSVATGIALGLKLKAQGSNSRNEPEGRVFCILSDGEIQEGQVWEAFNFAVRKQLNNLTFILDRNRVQIEHFVSEVASYGNVEGRMEAFGLNTMVVDGNETGQIIRVLKEVGANHSVPNMIVANTVAGKGVSFMENTPKWHDKVPSLEELKMALGELGVKDN
jgi:transketolase